MSDYIKREDAINAIHGITMYRGTIPWASALFNINKIPSADVVEGDKAQKEIDYWHDKAQSYEQTILKLSLNKADVVEIVRCKDCKHLYQDNECPLRLWFVHTENDYCSFGERADT